MVSAAAIEFSCPGCKRLLKLPEAAAGRRARCGGCKEIVRVPAAERRPATPAARASPPGDLEDELGSFLSQMISEERDPDATDGFSAPKRFRRTPAAHVRADDDDLDDLSPEEERALQGLRRGGAPGTAAPAPAPAAARVATPPAATRPERPPTATPPKRADPAPASRAAGPARAADGFPVDRNPGPFLVVRSISPLGIRIAFPATQLRDERFRGSVPPRCVFTGKPLEEGSYARPMVFHNHHGEGDELVRMMELRHEKAIGPRYAPSAFVEQTPKMHEMPDPFDLAMPYAVSAGHHESSLHCEAHVSPRHDGYCEVVIPSPELALAWVAAVNGICHESHHLLSTKGSKMSTEAWTRLDQLTRERIAMWCTFRRGEQFLAYARDSHSMPRDTGLGGVLVTDQRLVFHLYRTTWSMDLAKPITVYSRSRGESFGLAAKQEDGELRPMCNLSRGDAALLFEALEDAAASLEVVAEKEELGQAA